MALFNCRSWISGRWKATGACSLKGRQAKEDEFKVRESKHKLEPTRTGQNAYLFSQLLTIKLMKELKENPEETRAAASLPAAPSNKWHPRWATARTWWLCLNFLSIQKAMWLLLYFCLLNLTRNVFGATLSWKTFRKRNSGKQFSLD